MSNGEYSNTQETMILPLLQQKNIIGKPFITVSAKGIVNGLSRYPNDGADFGPDTLQGATAPGQYGPPYSSSVGVIEAQDYGNKNNMAVYYISSQTFSFLEAIYDILNGDTVVATVAVGTNPQGIAITPDGNYAYVTNFNSNNVSVIQISTNTVVATVAVGTNPQGIAITPDGNYAYVTNSSSNNVSVIQISTNTVVATVAVGTNPYGVAITPDGNYAYVANQDFNDVSVIQINSVVNTWHGIKGIIPLNRIYNQDLTAQTNATTTLSTASTISITPSFSGRVKIKAILRGSNNTLSDGIAVALYNGSTSIDSETYTQEGLASNEHTFALSFDSLSSPLTIGTAYSFTVQFAAVTGGTASIKVIEFSAEEY